MKQLHVLCGIPGSGKSTVAQGLSGHLISTDSIRKFLWQDEAITKHDKLVFKLAETTMEYLLGRGESVIFDATNLTITRRRRYITLARNNHAGVTLHWVNCPLETAIERNQKRERQVPVAGIKALYRTFQLPKIDEGFNSIKVYGQDLKLFKIMIPGITFKR